jgi:O-methyltransferase involved in polyketide biosynthesis
MRFAISKIRLGNERVTRLLGTAMPLSLARGPVWCARLRDVPFLSAMAAGRDFSTISPSAKSLLLLKSQTRLPFAREAAELLWGAPGVEAARKKADATPGADHRRRHFELRARSVDLALDDLGLRRVIEIAAGLSFRGLAMTAREDVFYVDTDLPVIAEIKAELVTKLHSAPLRGTLRVRPLDALDSEAFKTVVAETPPGPLAIVHEGLLMYLDDTEKAHLAASVHRALLDRGGAWVTADVYVRSDSHLFREESTKKFLEKHHVEQKKFPDFRAAEAFFVASGFTIARRLSSSADPWRVRETWVLSPRG